MASNPARIVAVAGARPNFMKIAPLLREIESRPGIEAFLVHTGQHYDEAMSESFFKDLGIAKPDLNLEVGSGFSCRTDRLGSGQDGESSAPGRPGSTSGRG